MSQQKKDVASFFDVVFGAGKKKNNPGLKTPNMADQGIDTVTGAMAEMMTYGAEYGIDQVMVGTKNERRKGAKIGNIVLDSENKIEKEITLADMSEYWRNPSKAVDAWFAEGEAARKSMMLQNGAKHLERLAIAGVANKAAGMTPEEAMAYGMLSSDDMNDPQIKAESVRLARENAQLQASFDVAAEFLSQTSGGSLTSGTPKEQRKAVEAAYAQFQSDNKKVLKEINELSAKKGTISKSEFEKEMRKYSSQLKYQGGLSAKAQVNLSNKFLSSVNKYEKANMQSLDGYGSVSTYRKMYADNNDMKGAAIVGTSQKDQALRERHKNLADYARKYDGIDAGSRLRDVTHGQLNKELRDIESLLKRHNDSSDSFTLDAGILKDLQSAKKDLVEYGSWMKGVKYSKKKGYFVSGKRRFLARGMQNPITSLNPKRKAKHHEIKVQQASHNARIAQLKSQLKGLGPKDPEYHSLIRQIDAQQRFLKDSSEVRTQFGSRWRVSESMDAYRTIKSNIQHYTGGGFLRKYTQIGPDALKGKTASLRVKKLGELSGTSQGRVLLKQMGFTSQADLDMLGNLSYLGHNEANYSDASDFLKGYLDTFSNYHPTSLFKSYLVDGGLFSARAAKNMRSLNKRMGGLTKNKEFLSYVKANEGEFLKGILGSGNLTQKLFNRKGEFDEEFFMENMDQFYEMLKGDINKLPSELQEELKRIGKDMKLFKRNVKKANRFSWSKRMMQRVGNTLFNNRFVKKLKKRLSKRLTRTMIWLGGKAGGKVAKQFLAGAIGIRQLARSGAQFIFKKLASRRIFQFAGQILGSFIPGIGNLAMMLFTWLAMHFGEKFVKAFLKAQAIIFLTIFGLLCGSMAFIYSLTSLSASKSSGEVSTPFDYQQAYQKVNDVGYTSTVSGFSTGSSAGAGGGSLLADFNDIQLVTDRSPEQSAQCLIQSQTVCTQGPNGDTSHARMRTGAVDIVPVNGKIYAPSDGVVTIAKSHIQCIAEPSKSMGGHLEFQADSGVTYRMYHVAPVVTIGQEITQGELLAYLQDSSDGLDTSPCWNGAHLHLDICSSQIDPVTDSQGNSLPFGGGICSDGWVNSEQWLDNLGCQIGQC